MTVSHVSHTLCCLALVLLLSLQAHARVSNAAAGFKNLPWDAQYHVANIAAESPFPSWLTGTVYRNGPGRYLHNDSVAHWFMGLSVIETFHFNEGRVEFHSQFLKTGVYNGSAPSSSLEKSGEGSPNTDVTIRRVKNHILANGPTINSNEIMPVTIAGGSLPFVYDDSVDALFLQPSHAQTDPEGNIVSYFVNFEPIPGYQLYTIPAGSASRTVSPHTVPARDYIFMPLYQHQFSLTKNFVVIPETPCTWGLDPNSTTFWYDFLWLEGVPAIFRVIERSSGLEVMNFTSSVPFFTMHTINAYEEEVDGKQEIVVDLLAYKNNSILTLLYLRNLINEPRKIATIGGDVTPTRFRLPLSQPGAHVTGTVIGAKGMELPTIHPALNTLKYTFVYAPCFSSENADLFDELVKLNVDTGERVVWRDASGLHYPGEALFLPRPGATAEDDGVLVSVVLDAEKNASYLLCLDASDMSVVSKAYLPYVVPFGFHGKFYSDL